MSCLDESTVARFVAGDLAPDVLERTLEHLDGCGECRGLVAAAARASDDTTDGETGDARDEGSAPTVLASRPIGSGVAALLVPGDEVGRYRIQERIGSGGMGTVYAALDPELGRRVAIKVLRSGSFGEGETEEGRARLRREARALAALSHPNIVAVHDVGAHRGQVFVAMELVEGVSLKAWMAERARSWQEVRETMLAAGRGLAAAHAAGLVHRDFKPDNVLVGSDGRVRVTDFGLARPVHTGPPDDQSGEPAPEGSAPGPDAEPSSTGLLEHLDLTRTGVAVGTPAYMAPEQHRGEATDGRTDQFAFCMVLYEALYRKRPFGGVTAGEITRAALRRETLQLPRDSRVPAWLGQIAARGLSPDPKDRYPNMEALLDELSYDPSRVRRRILLGVLMVGGLAAAAAVTWGLSSTGPDACKGIEKRLEGIWDTPRKAAGGSAFEATGKPYAAQAWRAASAVLDAYAKRWIAARRRACEARRATPGSPVAKRTIECLESRVAELRAVSQAFSSADPPMVIRALATAHAMGSLTSCENPRRLPPPEPDDPATRAKARAVRDTLVQSTVLARTGRYEMSRAAAARAVAEAKKLGYAPILAEAWFRLGEAQRQLRRMRKAEHSYREAAIVAEGSRHDEVAARARIRLVWVVGFHQEKHDQIGRLVRHAHAAIRRIGGDLDLEAALLSTRSSIASSAHRIEEALGFARRALALRERHYGKSHPMVASTIEVLAIIYAKAGRYREALTYFRRGLALREKALGPRHPQVGDACSNLGLALRMSGSLRESVPYLKRAIAINRAALGAKNVSYSGDVQHLGESLLALGQASEALRRFREALAIRSAKLPPGHSKILESRAAVAEAMLALGRVRPAERTLREVLAALEKRRGSRHPRVAHVLTLVARAQLLRGRDGQARSSLVRALAIRERQGPNHPELATVLTALGDVARVRKERAEAERLYRRALAIHRKAQGGDHWRVAEVLVGLGTVALDLARQPKEGAAIAARALAMMGKVEGPPRVLAAARFLRARAAWAAGEDRSGSVAEVRRALESLKKTSAATRLRGRMARWLAQHRRRGR